MALEMQKFIKQKQEDLTESSKQGPLTPVVKELELYPRSQQTISTCSGILSIHCEAHSRRLTDMYGKTKKVLNGI